MTLANGLVISKICYLIQFWGGCEDYLLHSLQFQMNRAARSVTGLSSFTSIKKLLDSCGWLTVKQLVVFKTKQLVHKTPLSKKSLYLHRKFCSGHTYTTRQHSTWCIRLNQTFRCKSVLPRNSFRHRGAYDYSALQADIRTSKTLQTFKSKLKRWIKMNIDSY